MRSARSNSPSVPLRVRCGFPLGIGVAAALLLGAAADDASAAALGGVATSFGLLLALSAILLLKAWQAHPISGGLPTVCGMLALAAGIALLWRSRWTPRRRALAACAPGIVDGGCSEPTRVQPISLPVGVDRQALVGELRRHFVEMQAAWDDNARDQLLGLTTPDMLKELCAARSVGLGAGHRTEVMSLDAHLVAFEELDTAQIVCVEFSGMIRESAGLPAAPFRELWLLTRADGTASGWRLARHQAML